MSLINFDVSLNPEKPKITFGATVSPTKLSIAVVPPIDLSLSVKPSTGTIVGGAIAGAILGGFVGGGITVGVVYGVAAGIQSQLEKQIKDNLPGTAKYDIDFGAPLGYTFDVQGVKVNIVADSLSLSTSNGMLMATGSVKVS